MVEWWGSFGQSGPTSGPSERGTLRRQPVGVKIALVPTQKNSKWRHARRATGWGAGEWPLLFSHVGAVGSEAAEGAGDVAAVGAEGDSAAAGDVAAIRREARAVRGAGHVGARRGEGAAARARDIGAVGAELARALAHVGAVGAKSLGRRGGDNPQGGEGGKEERDESHVGVSRSVMGSCGSLLSV